ncbi:MAG: hypothetical protein KDK99_17130 [Verrucomicrobiales bacterium]|nr:hypothetical protein [Verrucomicrobiales bacterium]
MKTPFYFLAALALVGGAVSCEKHSWKSTQALYAHPHEEGGEGEHGAKHEGQAEGKAAHGEATSHAAPAAEKKEHH